MSINILNVRLIIRSLQSLKNISKCCYATKNIVTELEAEEVPRYEIEPKYDDEEIEKLTNISGLRPHHRNIVHGRKPYDHSIEAFHGSVTYKRKLIGQYGIEAAEVSPGICWPSKEEIEDLKEYEIVEYPASIQSLWRNFEQEKIEEKEAIRKKEEEVDKAVARFDEWRAKLQAKIEKKEAAILEAKLKRERVMEEIREQFGFKIDPKDERFQEVMAQKEKEDKKRKKEEKKRIKQEKLMKHLLRKEEAEKASKGEDITKENFNNQSQNNNENDKNTVTNIIDFKK